MNDKLYTTLADHLRKDPVSYADMLDSVQCGAAKPVYAAADGAMIFQEDNRFYTIAADSLEAALPMLDMIEEPQIIMTHNDSVVMEAARRFNMPMSMYCHQFVYCRPRPLTVETPIGVELRPLSAGDTDYVLKNYHGDSDPDYIASRVEYGMTGAIYNGKLCGFVGYHSEGTIGLLFVAPECRRLGIGQALTATAVNRRIAEGRIPYDHVVLGNTASMKLQASCGFTMADKPGVWIFKD